MWLRCWHQCAGGMDGNAEGLPLESGTIIERWPAAQGQQSPLSGSSEVISTCTHIELWPELAMMRATSAARSVLRTSTRPLSGRGSIRRTREWVPGYPGTSPPCSAA